ncbi:hypothetical protein CWI84_00120 [Idiomarina tyrosinivorans]|uniref:DUF2371 domain-containing protein n=1 Tax=Idiomarina tyrosinivorans TaxID=1445662 RepID=A0A432ZTP0_9GAMM|nr:hypothetical protein [Idiomarina tyrosinivorans]RUO81211.1 hypothetical protein CWI84_00120 [Idiomarina tyrosinivorans]
MQRGPRKQFYIHQQGNGSLLARILSILILLVFVGLAITFGFVFLIIGAIVMIPVLWRQRQTIKQVWRMRKAAQDAQQYAQQQRQQQQQDANSRVFDGEYEEVNKDDK